MIRFLMMWGFFSAVAGIWLFALGKPEKSVMKTLMKNSAISAIIGAIVVAVLFLVNNIQGM